MNVEEYERMYEFEDSYWWFQGRLRIIESVLERYMADEPRKGRVLDIGCGTGLMLSRMREKEPVGIDFSRLALSFCRRRGISNLTLGNVSQLPYADGSLDLVLALDLMEHIEDDRGLVAEFHRVLRPGGWLMATVPAHPKLWSDHDVALHHFRRYTKRGYRTLLESAGFNPVKYSYGISFTYFPIIAFRGLQKWWHSMYEVKDARPKAHLIPLPPFINRPLIWLLHLEAALLRHVNLPVGISLVALCQKEGGEAMALRPRENSSTVEAAPQ